jgi:hypothetical protein
VQQHLDRAVAPLGLIDDAGPGGIGEQRRRAT